MPIFLTKSKTYEKGMTSLLRRIKKDYRDEWGIKYCDIFDVNITDDCMRRVFFKVKTCDSNGFPIELERTVRLWNIQDSGDKVEIVYDVFE